MGTFPVQPFLHEGFSRLQAEQHVSQVPGPASIRPPPRCKFPLAADGWDDVMRTQRQPTSFLLL